MYIEIILQKMGTDQRNNDIMNQVLLEQLVKYSEFTSTEYQPLQT